ncbi:unnamed protein product [Dibothriocephalus latus]|uniref:Liprin-alpha CC2 domain-containing protein n=1 Tax=Dibothriocephalus latus TaxID=60516 RepID=A0A3P7LGF3_DIBLA|nr:unnamed protein product [Dibothriocephalus latus]
MTVDKLLLESNERLQTHLREKMTVVEEKNHLTAELDRVRRQLEVIQSDRDRLLTDIERLKRQASLTESLDLGALNTLKRFTTKCRINLLPASFNAAVANRPASQFLWQYKYAEPLHDPLRCVYY